ncbi:MAG TPA: IreB family regulatory phosphoprotein [Firmicutes bacterium]|nr:IreB family regulatory phosphoprotein [Bacillota bacterium]
MEEQKDHTISFRMEGKATKAGTILRHVYKALCEKGYDPAGQIVGYLLSGDPTYITSHNNARNLMRSIERHEILEELLKAYLEGL